jgi:uncharacterized protein YjlB
MSATIEVQCIRLGEQADAPNHPDLPVIRYTGAFRDDPSRIGAVFRENRWLGGWTDGIYGYTHFHTNAHEALGVVSGSAIVRVGGEQGVDVELEAGDVVVLPAGTGHRRILASADFKVTGAYPNGMDWDLRTQEDSSAEEAREAIASVPLPETDPVFGGKGPVHDYWQPAYASRDGP